MIPTDFVLELLETLFDDVALLVNLHCLNRGGDDIVANCVTTVEFSSFSEGIVVDRPAFFSLECVVFFSEKTAVFPLDFRINVRGFWVVDVIFLILQLQHLAM